MKIPRMANAVGHIDEELVATAAGSGRRAGARPWRWAVAACLAALVIAGAAILRSIPGGDISPGGDGGRYREHDIMAEETAIIWPWEYLAVYERYTWLTLDGAEYSGKGESVPEELTGPFMGTRTLAGYDEITGERHTRDFEVYGLRYARISRLAAVKMDGGYYVFMNDTYAPPGTLGELFEEVDLARAAELGGFCENGGAMYALEDDGFIWETLAGCGSAPFVEDEQWAAGDREYLEFTVTSETLGVYGAGMYVTADGYLWTNAFGWQYLFDIGKEAAGEIIGHARGSSRGTPYEPRVSYLTGTVVETAGEYILVDDSVLCKDPADGITYKVLLNDIRLSRYVDNGVICAGDTIQVAYSGKPERPDTIDSAQHIVKVSISGGQALIPE